jgi:GMP synthase PP-ATPase subunit
VTALVLGALVAVAAVVLVSMPFLRDSADDDVLDTSDEAIEHRLSLVDERDRALGALKDLEFDHQTGKIDDVDYRRLVGPLRRAAADALRAIDEPAPDDADLG